MIGLKNISIFKLKILFIVGVLTFTSSTSIFSAEHIQEENAFLSSINEGNNELIITFELPELVQTQISTEQGVFTILNIPNSGFIGEMGKPQLPMWTRLYAVPNNQFSLEILESNILETRNVGRIYPAQQPQIDGDFIDESEFVFDKSFYQQDLSYPDCIVKILETGNIRDVPFVRIVFYPVQYNPKQEIVTIYDQISIKLTYNNYENVFVESNFGQTPFYALYENVFANWEEFRDNIIVEQNLYPNTYGRNSGCEYLIITHPSFYTQAKDLAEWKHKKGLMTKLVNVTDIGSTASVLRQYIQNAYDNWNPRPSYLLLVGDAEFIPTNYIYSAASDLWYATVNGTDYYPDLYYGRISVDTSNQAETIVQKILTYEQTPPTQASFYDNFTVAAYFQDDEQNGYETRRFVRTSEEIRDYLLSEGYLGERIYCTESYINPTHYNNGIYGNGEPLPPELLRPTFAWDGDAADIINAIEQGIFILNHRDHGFEQGWGDPYFDTSHIAVLTNGDLLPVVFSVNCLTGRFDGYESFCEEFVRKTNGGAVAAFGATRVSYSGYNDFLCRGFYDAIWPDFDPLVGISSSLYNLGAILNYGKYYMANTWGNPWGYERYTFELFHVFGDPEVSIWTENPSNFSVTHPSELYINSTSLTVHVENSSGNNVNNAYVCLWKEDEIYVTNYTNSTGNVTFYLSLTTTGTMNITVTKQNFIPYSVGIEVLFDNQPPYTPTNPNPTNGSTNVDVDANLSWNCSDPNGDNLTYNIYFEANDTTPDILVSNNQSGTTYDPGTMNSNTQYFWQIVAWDNHGASTAGPIWSFTTENNPPYAPSNPTPVNHATGVDINASLYWTGGDPDPGDTVTYDVYFSTSSSPPMVVNNQSANAYDPGTMSYSTKYYWKIVSWDNHGASTTGPIWDFTTGNEPNDPPNPPNDPSPEDGITDVSVNTILGWNCSDPDGDPLVYDVYLEADNPTPQLLVSDDQTGTTYDPGGLAYETTYYWQIIAKDNHSATTGGPIWNFTTEEELNNPPDKPIIDGPTNGKAGVEYTYCIINATDPDGDDLWANWSWGDGSYSGWMGPYMSGEDICASHAWEFGNYVIKVKIKDDKGLESVWSDPFPVSMPKNKPSPQSQYFNIHSIIKRLML